MSNADVSGEALLDTAVAESLWGGGQGADWLRRVVSGEVEASLSALSVAELARRAQTRRAEIQLAAMLNLVKTIDLDAAIAQRAGGIARELDSDDPSAMLSAVEAATALESGLPVACVDEDFFAAMGCEIAAAE